MLRHRSAATTLRRAAVGARAGLGVAVVSVAAALAASGALAATPRAPVITSVVFQGSPDKPFVILHGRNFGRRPSDDRPQSASGLGLCGRTPAPAGFDFGSALWMEDETQRWSAGYSRYVDCIGLILVTYKNTEIAYKFGSWYRIHFRMRNRFTHGIYGVFAGDFVNLKVRGVNRGVTVHYQSSSAR